MSGQGDGAGFRRERARVFRGPKLRDAPLRPLLVLRGYSSPGRVRLSKRCRCGSGEVRPSHKHGHFYRDTFRRTHTHSRQLIQRHPYRTRAHVRLKIPSWTQRQRDAGMGTLQAQPHTQRRCTQIQMHIRRNAFYSQMETDTCSHSPSEVHTCSARTHGLADAQTCSENTDVHPSGTDGPTNTAIHLFKRQSWRPHCVPGLFWCQEHKQCVKQTKPSWGREVKSELCELCRVFVGGNCSARTRRTGRDAGGCVDGGCNLRWAQRGLQEGQSPAARIVPDGPKHPESHRESQNHLPRGQFPFIHCFIHLMVVS